MADKRASKSQSAGNTPPRHHAHPLARWAWGVLRDRSEADKHLVFAALRQRLDPGPSNGKVQHALEALDRSRELLGLNSAPSRGQYDEFRAKQSQPKEWPSATLIRNALGEGSWQRAVAVADGKPLTDVTARRLISNGKAITRAELEPILRHWARHTQGPLRQGDFLAWCREEAGKEEAPFERFPLTANTLERRFGSWAEALAAVEELDRCTFYWRKKTKRPAAAEVPEIKRFDLTKLPSQKGGQYSRAQARVWLKWARRELHLGKNEPLTYRDYVALRSRLMREAHEEGRVVHMPSTQAISSHLGSFRNAQVALGLIEAKHAAASRARFEEKELHAAIIAAGRAQGGSLARALEGGLTQAGFIAWRNEQLGQATGADRVPSLKTLLARLGGRRLRWSEVLRRVEQVRSRGSAPYAKASREG